METFKRKEDTVEKFRVNTLKSYCKRRCILKTKVQCTLILVYPVKGIKVYELGILSM